MKCSYCGYENAEGSHFCSGCGKRLDRQGQGGNNGAESANQRPDGMSRQQHGYSQQEYSRQEYRQQQNAYQPRQEEYPERRRQAESGQRYGAGARQEPAEGRKRNGDEKKIILIGVILACVVVVAGVAAYLFLSRYMNRGDGDGQPAAAVTSSSEDARADSDFSSEEEPEETAAPTRKPTSSPTETSEPTPTEAPLTASLVDIDRADMTGCSPANVREAIASSVVEQEGYDNSAAMLVDGNVVTSWQEGASGDGINEFVNLKLDREYEVKYITLNLGNWRDQQRYNENNVPKTLTIWLDEKSFKIDFPHEQTQFCLEFSEQCPASEIYVRIDDVYEGSLWDDTCISEITIYGA